MKREASGVGSGVGKRAVKGEGEEIAFDGGAGELGGLRRGGGIANREGLLRQQVLAVGIREELELERFRSFCCVVLREGVGEREDAGCIDGG